MDDQRELLVKVSTKLDILVDDFKNFKRTEERNWKEFDVHAITETTNQANTTNILKGHSIVGAFLILGTLSYGAFLYYYIKDIEHRTSILEANSKYYYNNRDVTIEMIEDYKKKKKNPE